LFFVVFVRDFGLFLFVFVCRLLALLNLAPACTTKRADLIEKMNCNFVVVKQR